MSPLTAVFWGQIHLETRRGFSAFLFGLRNREGKTRNTRDGPGTVGHEAFQTFLLQTLPLRTCPAALLLSHALGLWVLTLTPTFSFCSLLFVCFALVWFLIEFLCVALLVLELTM